MNHIRKICLGVVIVAMFASCVPQKKYEDLKSEQQKCKSDNESLKSANIDLEKKNSDMSSQIAEMKKSLDGLQRDTLVQGTSLRQLRDNYDQINRTYELLLEKNKELLAGNSEANKKLMDKLQKSQADLQKQQDALQILQAELNKKKAHLDSLNQKLMEREARVKELESVLNRKDSIVKAIKSKVQDALLGFEDQGLSIEQKNGKVYVSLQEKLLFPSGSYTVQSKGIKVLKKLGRVLEKDTNINIMVEGHTDNVPYHSSGAIKDNWDLSVMRATSVVKIITSNSKVNPKRLIAAGRGEYMPVVPNDNAEDRKKNRRIDIILTPKLGELLQILNNN